MKTDLAVIGQGAVTPAGIGFDVLRQREPVATQVAEISRPEKSWPVLRVDLKDPAFARWQREPRLRRASPLSFFLVEAAAQAVAGLNAGERTGTGLIVAFSAGCVAYSRRFFAEIVKQGQKSASPALFPETVFNSPVSHVASVLGLNGAAYALVGDESAWVAALKAAATWLRRGRVKQVLVLGAEEFDPVVLDAYRSARWLEQKGTGGFLTSEGAAGILVRAAQPGDAAIIASARDGYIYRSRKEAVVAAQRLLEKSDPSLPCLRTARHNWFARIENNVLADRAAPPTLNPYLGEAFAASAAWNTLRALALVSPKVPRLLLPVWGLNHQLGLLEFGS